MELLKMGEGGRIEIHPSLLMIAEFKELWEADKHLRKEGALRVLSFVFFMCDYRSPYRAYAYEMRIEKLKNDVLRDKEWRLTPQVEAAMQKYEELQQSPSMSLLLDAQEAVLKIRTFFKEVDIASDTKGTKIAMLVKLLGSTGDIIKGLSMLQQKVEQETLMQGKMRGQGVLGHRELPKDKRRGGSTVKEIVDE